MRELEYTVLELEKESKKIKKKSKNKKGTS